MAFICVGLGLLVSGSPLSATLSQVAMVAALFLAITFGVGAIQPARSFWIALGLVVLGMHFLQASKSNPFKRFPWDLDTTVARHVYNTFNRLPDDFRNREHYILGNRVIIRRKDRDGVWKFHTAITRDGALNLGIDVAALPFMADDGDVETIFRNYFSLAAGLFSGWLAFSIRRQGRVANPKTE